MKNLYKLGFSLLIVVFAFSGIHAQSVSLSVTNNTVGSCGTRVITTSVSGGSGSYQYFWQSNPTSSVNLGNGPSISVYPTQTTTYTVAVLDLGRNTFVQRSITVVGPLTGTPDVFIPNVFTPNGDGFNDNWEVLEANKGRGAINAYRYELNVYNRSGTRVFSRSASVTTGTTGVRGGDITWNGRLNGTGGMVSADVYNASLRLFNCSNTSGRLYTFQISVVAPSGRTGTDESKKIKAPIVTVEPANEINIFPNPASTQVQIIGNNIIEGSSVELFDQSGRMILSDKIVGNSTKIDVSGFSNGIYFMQVPSQEGLVKKRLIIQK